MVLPELSHLQYLALTFIDKVGEIEGQDLQVKMGGRAGGERSGPAFYMFMGRLKEAEYIKQAREPRNRTSVSVYKLTAKGRKAMKANERFYEKRGKQR